MKRTTGVLLLALALFAGSLAGVVVATLRSETVATGVTIAGVDVGGITKRQVRERISPTIKQIRSRYVVLQAEDKKWRFLLQELGMSPDMDGAIAKAYAIGRRGNAIQRFIERCLPGGGYKKLRVDIAFDGARLEAALDGVARRIERTHKDAKLRVVGGRFLIEPEQSGVMLDVAKCARDIQESLGIGNDEPISLTLIEDKPDVTAADLRPIDTRLSIYTTTFSTGKLNRSHNIGLATGRLDGAIVKPGQVFSFNKTVGPRIGKLGYREAPVFINGELTPGTGGGVCQVSTTIYNAALYANMEIVQRSHHSGPVAYVPKGRDATVVYGALDLKFRNPGTAAVYISTGVTGGRITAAMYGAGADKREVEITRSAAIRIPQKVFVYQDNSLEPGARVIVRDGYDGYSVRTYRTVKQNGVVVKRETISKDRYLPLHTKVAVGPKPAGDVRTEQTPDVTPASM
ncbi:MAG: VanW family protein [Armatimonadota bacterium]|nr:VanW family protein [Armatimonadota bacterium]